MVIENYRGYEISKTKTGYRVTKLDTNKHTHLSSKNAAVNAVDYVLSSKIPKRTGIYYLTSLIRLSDDINYINKVNELIEIRINKSKKQNYYNPIKEK